MFYIVFSEVCLPVISWVCIMLRTMSYFKHISLRGIEMKINIAILLFYFPTLLANGLCWKKCEYYFTSDKQVFEAMKCGEVF